MSLPQPITSSRNHLYSHIQDDTPATSTIHLSPPQTTGQQSRNPSSELLAPPTARWMHDSSATSSSTLVSSYPQNGSVGHSINEKFSLSADPNTWDANISPEYPETDDELHNPDPRRDRKRDSAASLLSSRGLANLGCLILIATTIVMLFGGYPLISYYNAAKWDTLGGYNLGGINASGQVPIMPGNWGLIDPDTPESALTKKSYTDGDEWKLVFSDEFNVDGRTFYPGDDPYWEAEDLHYWGTNNLEWYDPAAVTTKDGNLVITLSKKNTHDLDYEGGLLTSWNKFCFTGGLFEVSAVLPGASDIYGLWPAVWTLGNLGRAGYGASLDGMWPYSYDSCDVGTLPNQTFPDGTPVAATTGNDEHNNGALSYLAGQRLSACTCKGEDHPGPKRSDGSYVGRSAPEIDVLEAQVNSKTRIGHVSQSGQFAPFDYQYIWKNTTDNFELYQADAELNSYVGGVLQQSVSVLALTNQQCYEQSGGCYSTYGFEYEPGNDGFITWVNQGSKSWTLRADGMGPNDISQVGQRPIPNEPMYLILNLGMSTNFGPVELDAISFPVHFLIDYVRVYQPTNQINVGCSPKQFPTEDYIQTHIEAYTNPNLTTWEQYGQTFPKNRLVDNC